MSKKRNGRVHKTSALVAGDSVGDVKLIGARVCRIISKKSDTEGVVALDGVVSVTKAAGSAWGLFQAIYRTSAGAYTATVGSNTLAGVAAAPAESAATSGDLLLNGLPAIDGD